MRKILVAVSVAACGGGSQPAFVTPPPAPAPPVAAPAPAQPAAKPIATDTYHGVVVEDRFRWLEEDTDEVRRWSDAHDRRTRAQLDALPEVAKLRAEITAIVKAPATHHRSFVEAGGKLFALRDRPDREQAELVVLADPNVPASAKLIFDPTAAGNALVTIDWYVPSPDGTRVAVSISAKGSEKGDLHVIDLDGKDVEPVIPHVQRGTAGGSAAWTPDGKGLYYTRYPKGGDFYMNLWFHAIGTPIDQDRYEMGKDLPKIGEIIVDTDKRGRVLAQVQNGDGGEFRQYLRDVKGTWKQLTRWDDRVIHCVFGSGDDLWCVSTKDAPRGKVLKLSPDAGLAKAKVVIAEGKDAIVTDFYGDDYGVLEVGGQLYLQYQVGGPSEVRAFSLAGKPAKALGLPPVSAVTQPMRWRDGVVVGASSYTSPRSWYHYSAKRGLEKLVALSPTAPVDLSSFEVKRELATSKDGTKVPLDIVWPARAPRDGSVPCVVTGYGGFGLSQQPRFQALRAPLLSRGFCVVQVNLRGGGEFGEAWHRGGMLTNKQNVFDDLAAALAFLVDNKYSSPAHLGIIGWSNGGLLMGAMLVQHPQRVKAVVAAVGIYDMLRVERTTNGQFNIPEYGTVADAAQFKALHAYSPYHHVVPSKFPATLFMTGANDSRVEPWHSRKMLAAMLAANTGTAPLLLRVSKDAGHGTSSTADEIEQTTTISAFFLSQLK